MLNKFKKLINDQWTLWGVIIILLFGTISYWRVPSLFFQQDELLGFGLIIERGWEIIFRGFASSETLHFIPLLNFFDFVLFQAFSLNYFAYNIIGILVHFLNGFLVYILAFLMVRHRGWALLATLVFISSSSSAQLVMWPLVSIGMLSLTFALLSWIFLIRANSVFTGIFLALSLFTAEYAVGLILFIPLAAFFKFNFNVKSALRFLIPSIFVILVYITLRIPSFFYLDEILNSGVKFDVREPSVLQQALSTVIRFFWFPVRYLGEVFIPGQLFVVGDKLLASFHEKLGVGELMLTNNFLWRVISISIGGVILLLSLAVIKGWWRSKGIGQWLFIVLLFLITSAIPFTFLPGKLGNFALFPPRYLYFGIAGISLGLAIIGTLVFLKKKRILQIVFSSIVAVLVGFGVYGNVQRSENLYVTGEFRKHILNEIRSKYPDLPKRVIFYTESDTTYYGLPNKERILPFQSGFGQTLLIWYYPSEKFPKEFFRDKFLWEITNQGYMESGDKGFGYFRDFEQMAETIRKTDIPRSSIVAFQFDSTLNTIYDISEQIRGRLDGYFVDKREVQPYKLILSSSHSRDEVKFVVDGKRSTFWNSYTLYRSKQFFEIDLNEEKTLAKVLIDSYNNKDQNEVGYNLFLSKDNQEWESVFYAKRYPPKEDGMVNLYFKPTTARYIRIEQIGSHGYAPWVIHELKIYEAI